MNSEFVKHAGDSDFSTVVLKEGKPTLVDFWAPWCGPCRSIGPIVEELAEQFKDGVKVMKLNVDDSQKTAINFNVRSIPTLILFKDGQAVDTIVGLVPKEKLENLVRKAL